MKRKERLLIVIIWETTRSTMLGKQTILQVDPGLANYLVGANEIVVFHAYAQVFLEW